MKVLQTEDVKTKLAAAGLEIVGNRRRIREGPHR